jgi:hypothetical protein
MSGVQLGDHLSGVQLVGVQLGDHMSGFKLMITSITFARVVST